MKLKGKVISVPIFDAKILFIKGANTPSKLSKVLHRFDIDNVYDDYLTKCRGFCTSSGPFVVSITADCPGTVSHECLHAAMRVLKEIGNKEPDEEVVAYLMTYLVEKFMKFLK